MPVAALRLMLGIGNWLVASWERTLQAAHRGPARAINSRCVGLEAAVEQTSLHGGGGREDVANAIDDLDRRGQVDVFLQFAA